PDRPPLQAARNLADGGEHILRLAWPPPWTICLPPSPQVCGEIPVEKDAFLVHRGKRPGFNAVSGAYPPLYTQSEMGYYLMRTISWGGERGNTCGNGGRKKGGVARPLPFVVGRGREHPHEEPHHRCGTHV